MIINDITTQQIEGFKQENIFRLLNSKEELKAWLYLYFDTDFPMGVVYPGSTHAPIDAAWDIYELIKTGKNEDVPEVVLHSARDSGKTSIVSALEVLIMIHFQISCAHMAAIESQSLKAVSYVEKNFRKVEKYLIASGWKKTSTSKRRIEWLLPNGDNIYLTVIIGTLAGANCINPDAMITMSDRTLKMAKDIVIGDKLLTFDYWEDKYKEVTVGNVTWTEKFSRKLDYGDRSLVVSDDQQIFSQNGWVCSDQLKVGCSGVGFGKGYLDDTVGIYQAYISNNGIVRCVDTGKIRQFCGKLKGFCWEHRDDKKLQKKFYSKIQERLNLKLNNSEYVGKKKLIDIHIDTKNEHEKSFFANGILVHNSEHVPMLCVEGKTKIKIKSTDGIVNSKRKRINSTARGIYNLIKKGVEVEALTYNHINGLLEFKKIEKSFKSKKKLFTVEFSNTQKNIKNKIGLSEDHPVFIINKGYDKLKNLSVGDFAVFLSEIDQTISRNILGDICKFNTLLDESIGICNCCGKEFLKKDTDNFSIFCNDILCQSVKTGVLSPIKIEKITNENKKVWMYDFEVKDNHNFFANGILVHNCVDEIDLISDSKILEEAKMIPSAWGKFMPITIYLSTLKFKGGLMEKVLTTVKNSGGRIYKWNMVDITEAITPEEARVNDPKVTRYITKELPMSNLSEDQWNNLSDTEKTKYERFEAYAGIAENEMLPVIKNYLVERPQTDKGGFYKKLKQLRNNFRKLDIEMADAQILCNKPSTHNLVIPRFCNILNTLTIQQFYEKYGIEYQEHELQYEHFCIKLKAMEPKFIGGGDWGYTDFTTLSMLAQMKGGDTIVVDSFIEDRLELCDIVDQVRIMQSFWGTDRWYLENAYPSYITTLKRELKDLGIRIPDFTKKVSDGITAMRARVSNSMGQRKFFVLDIPKNKHIIDAFGLYAWKLDSKGNIIEGEIYHDKEGVTDTMDSIRYPMQNLFTKNGKLISALAKEEEPSKAPGFGATQEEINKYNAKLIYGNNVEPPQQNNNNEKKTKKIMLWA